jgi:chemotaxis protein histidine kinase CheA/CheY-like chemotaxis protein
MSDGELDFDAEELAMLRQLFRDEAHEALETVTARVLAGGSAQPSAEALTEMMRVTHTLKGAAGTVGLETMVDLSHRLESALAALGREPSPWTSTTADLLVEVVDGLRSYLDHVGDADAEARADAIRRQIDQIARPDRRVETQPPAFVEPPPEPVIEAAAAEASELGAVPEPKPLLRVEPERIDELMSSAGELLFDRTRIERRVQVLRTVARDLARTRQTLQDAIAEDDAGGAGAEIGNELDGLDGRRLAREVLIEAEAALAVQSTLLSQTTAALLEEVEALRGTIGELQHGLTRIRMESARSLMVHAARALRALRRATGVTVELRTIGEETEFDKAVAEQLIDPITQLLRNAVAHGVESPEERAAQGKPAVATITIRAQQEGSSLVLEVSDDGRGIDTGALRKRLVATGRWNASRAQLANDAEVLEALLATGVSIRREADELAGRGVGLGLVQQAVAKLGGEVKVASTPGKGTTFTLRLPVSTTLAQAMLFKVDGQVYALPSVHAVDTTLVDAHATTAEVGHDVLPVVRLEQLLGRGAAIESRPAVVVSFAGKRLVCTVDKIIGVREIVLKPLGPLLAPLTLYSGATVSGSGKVQLILDPAQLVRRAYPDPPAAAVDRLDERGSGEIVLVGRALVVDDSLAIREAMTSMLGGEGWIVDVADSGARALQMTRRVRYDLVVTDLEMPGLDGFDLIARLRNDARFKATPIVIITSRASPEHRRRARELEVRALVAKPITRRKLLEALAGR